MFGMTVNNMIPFDETTVDKDICTWYKTLDWGMELIGDFGNQILELKHSSCRRFYPIILDGNLANGQCMSCRDPMPEEIKYLLHISFVISSWQK